MIPGYDMGNALDIQMQDKAGGDLTEFLVSPVSLSTR